MQKKLFSIFLLLLAIALFIYFDVTTYLSLDYIKSNQLHFADMYHQQPFFYISIFFIVYVLTTALSVPGATLLTLLAGALFGSLAGTILVSLASSAGATIAFLGARWFLKDSIQRKFTKYLSPFNKGIEKEGAFYLFTLRLTPVVPFFIINLVMGLTPMRTTVFFLVSLVGMFPATLLYVNAGTQLATIQSLKDIVSTKIIISLIVLGVFPLIIKKIVDILKSKAIYKKYKKPKKFDYNLIVIGAGSAGLVTSYIASAAKAKVALIEKHKMGGDCLNTGCVPSKSLIRSAKFLSDIRQAKNLGIRSVNVDFKFSDIMQRVQRIIKTIEPHDSVERYRELGVECHSGEAKIKSPWIVTVNGVEMTTKSIVIATGARPFIPNIPGLEDIEPLTSDTLWKLQELPKKLLVIGAGPIGLELAQCFARFGSHVTVIEKMERLLVREDVEVSDWLSQKLKQDGVHIITRSEITSVVKTNDSLSFSYNSPEGLKTDTCSHVLIATGRKANTENLDLQNLGIELQSNGAIVVNQKLQTNFPNIYACGDVTGMYQFTHTAAYQAWFASMNALLRPFFSFRAKYDVIPWCTYTDPEIARVGINENEAKNQNLDHQVTFYNLDHSDRALTEENAFGFVKIISAGKTDKILGVTIVGLHAGDCLAEFVLAMKHGLGLNTILQTIHTYPTLTEANKMAAGQWKKKQLSQRLLHFSEIFNKWQRS